MDISKDIPDKNYFSIVLPNAHGTAYVKQEKDKTFSVYIHSLDVSYQGKDLKIHWGALQFIQAVSYIVNSLWYEVVAHVYPGETHFGCKVYPTQKDISTFFKRIIKKRKMVLK